MVSHIGRIGRQYQNARAIIPPTADVPRFWAHQPRHPSNGLTPAKMLTLLDRADRGDMEAQSELISDIFDKEPTLLGLFQTRAYAVLSKKWEIVPNEGETESKAKKQAKWITEVLQGLSISRQSSPLASQYLTWEELREYLLTAVPYGYAIAFPEWDRKTWTMESVRAVEHKHFRFGDIRKYGTIDYNPYELRYLTTDEPVFGVLLEPNQAIVHYYKAKPVLPVRFSLIRTLIYWWMFKARAVASQVKFAERSGMPLAVGYYDPNAKADDKMAIKLAVENLGEDAAAVISRAQGDSAPRFEYFEPSTNLDVHDRLVKLINDEYSKAVLGHTSAAEATPGKLGEQTDSIEAQNYRIERDAIALDATINEQIIRVMAEGVDGKVLCHYKTHYEREENQNEKAKRYQALATIPGFRIPAEHVAEEFNIPVPTDGEETVGTPALTDPAAILATQAARQGAQAGVESAKNARKIVPNTLKTDTARSAYMARYSKADAHRAAIDAVMKRLNGRMAPVYASLLDGVGLRGNIGAQIRENLPRFKTDALPVIRTALYEAGNSALRAYGLGDADETGADVKGNTRIFRNADDARAKFNLKDEAAASFLEYQAFTVTEIEGEKITDDMRARIERGVAAGVNEGITHREFMARILDEAGVAKVNPYHMETVFRTNLSTAANASKLFGMAKHREEFPGWQFTAVMDNDTTEYCAPLDGRLYASTDTRNMPPLHFNCRSEAVPVGRDEWADEGYDALVEEGDDAAGAKGFENRAVTNFTAWVQSETANNPALADAINQMKDE